MWLFEVHGAPRPGFRISLTPGRVGVQMGVDDQYGCQILPLGQSLSRLLVHTEDQSQPFTLLRGNLKDTTSGLCLVKQTEREATNDRRALVIVDGCHDPAVGVTRIAEAYGYSRPEFITYTRGDGCKRELYLFQPGDALFICWAGDGLEHSRPKRFIVLWDGLSLTEVPCFRKNRPRRQRHSEVQTLSAPAKAEAEAQAPVQEQLQLEA